MSEANSNIRAITRAKPTTFNKEEWEKGLRHGQNHRRTKEELSEVILESPSYWYAQGYINAWYGMMSTPARDEETEPPENNCD